MATKIVVFPSLSTHIPVKFAGTTECSTFGISRHPGDGSLQVVEGKLDEAALSRWLDEKMENLASHCLKEQAILHSLQVLTVPLQRHDDDTALFSLTEKSFQLLKANFNLHEHFISIMTNQHTRAFSHPAPQGDETSSDILLFKGRFHPIRFFQLTMKYVPKSNTTFALLIYNPEYQSAEMQRLVPSIHMRMETCNHALVLPIYLAEQHIEYCASNIHSQNCKLDEVQIMTGQYSSADYVPGVDLFMLEFTEMTRLLNTSAENTTHQVFTLKGFAVALPVLKAWGTSLSHLHSVRKDKDALLLAQAVALDKLEYLNGVIAASLIHAEHVEKRIETYRQLVYQLMAQKDSRTNIELAKSSAAIATAAQEDSAVMRQIALETKRDSSAMKTIAMLTMFFLPGTFVAAIFAMPVFEWDGTGTPALKSGFKRYWTITVPLTVTVFLIWGAANLLPWRSWVGERLRKKTRIVTTERELEELEDGGRSVLKCQLRCEVET